MWRPSEARGGRHCGYRTADCGFDCGFTVAIRNPQSATASEATFRRAILADTRIAWPSGVSRDRRACGSPPAQARRSRPKAACVTASFSSRSTSAAFRNPHAQSAIRNPQYGIRRRAPGQQHRTRLAPADGVRGVHRFDKASGKVRAAIVDRYERWCWRSVLQLSIPSRGAIAR